MDVAVGEWFHDGGTEKRYALVRGSEGVGAFGGGRTSECVPDLVRSECPGDEKVPTPAGTWEVLLG